MPDIINKFGFERVFMLCPIERKISPVLIKKDNPAVISAFIPKPNKTGILLDVRVTAENKQTIIITIFSHSMDLPESERKMTAVL
jgi:hypothetical protein